MLKVAIVGCGKIADAHAAQIQRIDRCTIVAACDQEELMARQLSERFHIPQQFADLTRLIKEAKPDVIHITTPPQSHYRLAKQCLESGCHVYIEKPFTLYAPEAEELLEIAVKTGQKLTVGHDEQFGYPARRMRQLLSDGYLGGMPVHLECTWCYDLSDPTYAKALLTDPQHWARSLPGRLLHNVISHGVAKIAEFFPDTTPEVIAHGFVSSFLRGFGGKDIVDELRVIVHDHQRTAYFTFSTQMRPLLNQLCLYGPKNGLKLDFDRNTVIKLRGQRHKSYLESFVPPLNFAGQQIKGSLHNINRFLRRDFQYDGGKKILIESLYRSILDGAPVPIPYGELLLTSKIMDAIFSQLTAVQGPRTP